MSEKDRSSDRRNGDRRSGHTRKIHRRGENIPVDNDRRSDVSKRKEYQRKGSRREEKERRD